ncbi:hypothetical protein LINGRAHAP2_LOCUS31173, partial [Linum grandiflorum]
NHAAAAPTVTVSEFYSSILLTNNIFVVWFELGVVNLRIPSILVSNTHRLFSPQSFCCAKVPTTLEYSQESIFDRFIVYA